MVFAPGFGHVAGVARAVDLQHVSVAADRVAHGQEVWPGATYGELGQVGERLADGRPEQEGAHHLVKGGQVLVELGVGVQTLCVHQVGLSCGDLEWTEGTRQKKILVIFLLYLPSVVRQRCWTHDDDGAGDGDGSHASMGDGVSPVGVTDVLVIAVDSSLVRSEYQRQDG